MFNENENEKTLTLVSTTERTKNWRREKGLRISSTIQKSLIKFPFVCLFFNSKTFANCFPFFFLSKFFNFKFEMIKLKHSEHSLRTFLFFFESENNVLFVNFQRMEKFVFLLIDYKLTRSIIYVISKRIKTFGLAFKCI